MEVRGREKRGQPANFLSTKCWFLNGLEEQKLVAVPLFRPRTLLPRAARFAGIKPPINYTRSCGGYPLRTRKPLYFRMV